MVDLGDRAGLLRIPREETQEKEGEPPVQKEGRGCKHESCGRQRPNHGRKLREKQPQGPSPIGPRVAKIKYWFSKGITQEYWRRVC